MDEKVLVKLPRKAFEASTVKGAPKKKGGVWTFSGGEFLDHDDPAVQEFAFELLMEGLTWKAAMNFGGSGEAGDVSGELAIRAFRNTMDVIRAAKAHVKRTDGLEGEPWAVKRPRVADVLAKKSEVAA